MTTDRRATPLVRQHDPCAQRMLDALLRLERSPWPAAMQAYGSTLVALSVWCERHREAKGEVYHWAMREIGGVLAVRGDARRACLTDALHEAVARVPGLLLRFRAGLTARKTPNLRSMLAAWVRWRGKDLLRSTWGRHADRGAAYVWDGQVDPGRSDTSTLAHEVLALLDRDNPAHQALMLVGLGESMAEAARRTGASRQQVYRARDALLAIVDDDTSED